MKNLLLSLILFAAVNSYASKAFISSSGELHVNGSEFNEHWFFITYQPASSKDKSLLEQFSDNAVSKKYIEEYQWNMAWGSRLLWGGLAAALTYAVVTPRDSYSSGTYWGLFGVPYITGIFFMVEGQRDLVRAVNIYNGVDEKLARNRFRIKSGTPVIKLASWSF